MDVSTDTAPLDGHAVLHGASNGLDGAAGWADERFASTSRFSRNAQMAMTSRLYAISIPVIMISFFVVMDDSLGVDGGVQQLLVKMGKPREKRQRIPDHRFPVLGNPAPLPQRNVRADCGFNPRCAGNAIFRRGRLRQGDGSGLVVIRALRGVWGGFCFGLAHVLGCGNGGVVLLVVNRFFVSFAPVAGFALQQVTPMAMQPRGNPVVSVAPLRGAEVRGHDGPPANADVEQVQQIGRRPLRLVFCSRVVDDEKPCLPSKAQLMRHIASALLAGANRGPTQEARRRRCRKVHPDRLRNKPSQMRLPGAVAFAVGSPQRQPARRAGLTDAADVPGCDVTHFGKDGIR